MEAQKLYYQMLLIREAEKAIIREYPFNEIKTPCHLAIGAEAIAVAICDTWPRAKYFASYRNHHWYLACGGSLKDFFLELYGKENPIADGKAGSMHLNCPENGLMLTSAIVATQLGPAIGHAFAQSYKRTKELTVVAFGDGAIEEGAFHETMNLAALFQLPILFVLEDNDLAIHQTKENRQAFRVSELVGSYGIDYHRVEGASLDRVLGWSKQIRKFPAFLHVTYHRFLEHVGVNEDYEAGYRERPPNPDRLDPIKILPLQDCVKSLTAIDRENIAKQVDDDIHEALRIAKAGKPAPLESLVEHVFSV